jgi:DNA-binding CsgD family transcriptional regulator
MGDHTITDSSTGVSDWPLVGRGDELRLLRDLLTASTPHHVVLAGPAGVGKTRLAQEGVAVARQLGMDIAEAAATRSAAQIPFGAVASLLHAAAPRDGAFDDRFDVLRRSVAALAARPDDQPLLLVVDDAHLLDDASATLVHQIAATGVATVLATVRAGEPAPDPVVALWKDELATRIEVGALAPEATAELLGVVLGGPVDPATAVQFTDRCQGNALVLRELLTGARDDGSLREEGGLWRVTAPLSPSDRLVEIVEARLGRLDDDERALMELAAYGEPLGQAELTALSEPAVIEGLERRGLLVSRLDGRRVHVHLAHPVYGDVVRARTPALRVRAVAESLATAIEEVGARRHEDVLRVAAWRLVAGGGDRDVLLDGATVARWRYDFPLAERLARAAVEAGAGFDAALLAAHVTALQGRRDEAEAALAELAATAVTDGEIGQVAIARHENGAAATGHHDAHLDAAAAAVTEAGDWRYRLAARGLASVLDTQGPRAAAEAALALVDRARGDALVSACLIGAHSLARLGRIDAALELSERGATARQDVGTPLASYPWWHTVTRCTALQHAGRFSEARRLIDEHHGQALAEGSAEAQAAFAVLGAGAVGDRGGVETAAAQAREALAVHVRLGLLAHARRDHTVGALACGLAGRTDEAAEHLAGLDDLGVPPLLRDEVDVLQARGWAAAGAGDVPGASQLFTRAADLGERIGDLVGEAAALHALARLGRAGEVRERLTAVAARIEGDLAPARAAHVDALVQADAPALDKVSLEFEAMGADLLAAEAAADAAVARRRVGDLRDAAGAARRAGLLAARAEEPATPALHAIEARARLTPAERETAGLAAAGRSNKEIAAHLVLSTRTVENRLQRVYEKLGIAGRADLAAELAPDADD